MTGPRRSDGGADGAVEDQDAARRAERRRRRAQVFGDVLPDSTSDERGPGSGRAGESDADDWLRRQVPPHHG